MTRIQTLHRYWLLLLLLFVLGIGSILSIGKAEAEAVGVNDDTFYARAYASSAHLTNQGQ